MENYWEIMEELLWKVLWEIVAMDTPIENYGTTTGDPKPRVDYGKTMEEE